MKKNKLIQPVNLSSSFLFEGKRVSYIIKSDQNFSERKVFFIDDTTNIDKEKFNKKLEIDNHSIKTSYNFIDVSVLNDKFTLIPLDYFDEDNAELFLNYTVPFISNMGVRFNLIPQFNLVLVFYYSDDLDNLFSSLSDKVRITHIGFKFLSKINTSDRNREGIFLNFYQDYFEVAVIDSKTLLLYNIYPYKSFEDILYFLQLISNTLKNNLFSMKLFYYGTQKNINEYINKLTDYFKEVNPGSEDNFERENFTTLDV